MRKETWLTPFHRVFEEVSDAPVVEVAPLPVEIVPQDFTPAEFAPVEVAPVEFAPVEVAPVEVAPPVITKFEPVAVYTDNYDENMG